ncbi:ATP-grasp domain protein [Bacteroides finegoldii]|jgi:phosphoribosylglycinamide synthetase, ATP-grasp (A) domain|uniref:ATP-grasp domain-containing protein n=1 Tax=Bacteroides finegoldii CL09T03C10 TaxID=997888 RepID=K5DDF3_9BACE|nr:ATP-grasp domain-containing protein [Bacteroides finegoldii]EKJ91018.1 hypothetical protein HMPREF1057_02320 [Bacteroides finegoldii CL09T03C10]
MANTQKKILMLGGLRYLIPVIQAAHELGYYVITCDYLPHNIAHKYADEYHNISITNKNAVLELAKDLKINGIMSFAVDPGVLTAAYVCDKLGLPGNPYTSVQILQNKDLFRNFLKKNGFNTPKSCGYDSVEEALSDIESFQWPIIVKPVDSAGSKGVSRIDRIADLEKAIIHALKNSFSHRFIIEEFIEQQGHSSDSDAFSINGELKFISFSDQYFDNKATNPYTPSAYSWPSSMTDRNQESLSSEIQRLLQLLHMNTSIYNIETRVGTDGKAYIMEVSPRGGGNRLSEILRYATGTDLIKNAVRAAVGETIPAIAPCVYNGYWSEIILHADKTGIFKDIQIKQNMKENHITEIDLWVQPGDIIHSFNGANDAIGTLVVNFNNKQQQHDMMSCINSWVKIITE